jgi:hypothetical protein
VKLRGHEWLILVIAIACVIYVFACLPGCAGMVLVWNTISGNTLRILIASVVAVTAALFVGAPLVPAAIIGAAASTATLLSEPPQVIEQKGPPMVYGMPMWFWFVVGYVASLALRNRHWLPFFFSKQAKGYRLALLKHFILGGKPPVIPPQFLPDAASPP